MLIIVFSKTACWYKAKSQMIFQNFSASNSFFFLAEFETQEFQANFIFFY